MLAVAAVRGTVSTRMRSSSAIFLGRSEADRTAHEDVAAERASHQEVLHGLAPDAVRDPGEHLVRGERDRGLVDVVGDVRRAGVAQPRRREVRHHVGMIEGAPALVEILVHQVGEILGQHRLDEAADLGIELEVERARILDRLGEAEGLSGRVARRRRMALGVFEDQPLQRGARHPAGRGVVRDIERAAGPQPGAGEGDDRATHRGRDPAVDAVQRDDVELPEVVEARREQLVEARFDEADVVEPGGPRERPRGDDMGRVEVDADEVDVRVGGGERQRGEPVAAAELAVARPAAGQVGFEAGEEQRRLEMARGELRVESERVGGADVIALAPVGHHRIRAAVTCASTPAPGASSNRRA